MLNGVTPAIGCSVITVYYYDGILHDYLLNEPTDVIILSDFYRETTFYDAVHGVLNFNACHK